MKLRYGFGPNRHSRMYRLGRIAPMIPSPIIPIATTSMSRLLRLLRIVPPLFRGAFATRRSGPRTASIAVFIKSCEIGFPVARGSKKKGRSELYQTADALFRALPHFIAKINRWTIAQIKLEV